VRQVTIGDINEAGLAETAALIGEAVYRGAL
jgi:hypothetical protein